jgi:transposase
VGTGEACPRFSVSRSSVERFWNQQRKRGHLRPKQIGGYRRSRLEQHDRTLKRWIAEQADLTLSEMKQRCLGQLGVRIGINALWHRLDRLGLSYKKNDARRRTRAS